MTLRTKTLAVIGTTLVLMIAFIFTISRVIVLDGYAGLEKQNMLRNAEQSAQLLDDELARIASVVGDWAPWDDTYHFVRDLNREYIVNNLSDATVINLPVDFLVYLDVDGTTVYCKYVDPASRKGTACPSPLLDLAESNPPLVHRGEEIEAAVTGLAVFSGVPALLASGPILTSRFTGPVRGTLVAGRYLSEREIQRLAGKVNYAIRVHPLEDGALPEDFQLARPLLSAGEKTVVMALDDETIGAYKLLDDLGGEPLLMLGISQQRLVYAHGKASLVYFLIAICVTGLVFIIATLLFLEFKVLSRLVRLNAEVQDIGRSGDLQRRTTVQGSDELAGLSAAINQMVESVRVSTERDRAILETMEDGYFELDPEGRVSFFNDALARLFGYAGRSLQGVDYRQLMNRSSARKTYHAMKRLYATGRPITGMETGFVLEGGREIFLESTISLIRDGEGRAIGFRGIARDVTERRRLAEELIQLAYHDSLTGLYNRKAFYEHMKNEIAYATRYRQQRSLLFIDLDRFKAVNDLYGHAVGDLLLQHFVGRVRQILRSADTFSRLGGDEFVIILSEPQAQSPEVVAKRILDMLEEPFLIEGKTIDFISASIGISVFPQDGADAETLLLKADNSMYRAKALGGASLMMPDEGRDAEP